MWQICANDVKMCHLSLEKPKNVGNIEKFVKNVQITFFLGKFSINSDWNHSTQNIFMDFTWIASEKLKNMSFLM